MPSPDDHLTDIPSIVPERDDDAPYRRQRPEPQETRKPAKAPRVADASASPGVSGAWRALAVAALAFGIVASATAVVLLRQSADLKAALEQSNLRISDLEGRLSSTGDSMNQSSASMQVKLKELGSEVDKLWAASRKSGGRSEEMEATLKKLAVTVDTDRRQISSLAAGQDAFAKQLAANEDRADALKTLREQQAGLQTSLGRLNSTMTSLASTQSAQESRIKETEQWVKSNIEFRKQVTQRLTRLENPPSALPVQ